MTDQQKLAVEHREATAKSAEQETINWLREHCPSVTLGDADTFAKVVGDNIRQGMREALEIGQNWQRS